VTFSDEDIMQISVDFPETYNGQVVKVGFTIQEGNNLVAFNMNISVTDDDVPWLVRDLPDLSFEEDTLAIDIINLRPYFIDPDDDMLKFTAHSAGKVNVYVSNLTWDVTLSAMPDYYGTQEVIFRAQDKKGAFSEATVVVTVLPVNDPPKLGNIPPITMGNGTYRLSLTDFGLSDKDNDLATLKISVSSESPDLLAFVNGLDIFLIGSSSVNTKIHLNVSDGQATTSQIVLVSVLIVSSDDDDTETQWLPITIITIVFFIPILVIIGIFIFNYWGFYSVEEIYLVYKDGRLIFHKLKPGLKQRDEDIVTSMLTAIQEFVQETFKYESSDESVAIKKMEFGGRKIVIERGETIYIAVLLKGVPGLRLQRQMQSVIERIEDRYSEELDDWNGVVTDLHGIYKFLNVLLRSNSGKAQQHLDMVELTR
jgi:hypothetical protein